MTIKDIRGKSDADLQAELTTLAEQAFKLTCTAEAVTPKKGVELRGIRKDIARIKTVLNARSAVPAGEAEIKQIDERLKKAGRVAQCGLRARRAQVKRSLGELKVNAGKK